MLLVPGRPATDALTWWVDDQGKGPPAQWQLNGVTLAAPLIKDLTPLGKGGAGKHLVVTSNLQADTPYKLSAADAAGKTLGAASSRTLPASLAIGKPFTILVGSCFCPRGGTAVRKAHTPKVHAGDDDPIRVRFLVGDQMYMDLSPTTGWPTVFFAPDAWERYRQHWANDDFTTLLAAQPTVVMADDHEYWNDYPHGNIQLVWTNAKDDIRNKLANELDAAFDVYQAILNTDPQAAIAPRPPRTYQLDIGSLSFFVLDTRTRRTRFDDASPHMSEPAELHRTLSWLKNLDGPGVLIVSQPLIETAVSQFQRAAHTMGDVNLPEYSGDYAALWEAIFDAPHDVLLMSGDIHWSRLMSVKHRGRMIYEAISSPLSRIPFSVKPEMPKQVEWGREGERNTASCQPWSAPIAEVNTYATLTFVPAADGKYKVTVRWWKLSTESIDTPQLAHEPRALTLG